MLGRKTKRNGKKPARRASWALFYIPQITSQTGLFTDDRDGYIFEQVLKVLGRYTGREIPDEVISASDNAVNEYIRNYGMILLLHDHEGNSVVFSANYRNKLSATFTERLRRDMGIVPESQILWASDVYATPRKASAREVIWGEKLTEPPKPTKAKAKKQWAHPEGLTPEEMDYLTGKSEKEPPS